MTKIIAEYIVDSWYNHAKKIAIKKHPIPKSLQKVIKQPSSKFKTIKHLWIKP